MNPNTDKEGQVKTKVTDMKTNRKDHLAYNMHGDGDQKQSTPFQYVSQNKGNDKK